MLIELANDMDIRLLLAAAFVPGLPEVDDVDQSTTLVFQREHLLRPSLPIFGRVLTFKDVKDKIALDRFRIDFLCNLSADIHTARFIDEGALDSWILLLFFPGPFRPPAEPTCHHRHHQIRHLPHSILLSVPSERRRQHH